MNALRLQLAVDAGLRLPDRDCVALHPPAGSDLGLLGAARVVHPMRPEHDHFARLGYDATPQLTGSAEAACISLPRAKNEARMLIAAACDAAPLVMVDGQKTDGITSVLRDIQSRTATHGVISKGHGKLFWMDAAQIDVSDWHAAPALTPGGFWTGPGVFSADGVDPGSALLAQALPEDLGARGADLGAGWGYLSAHILTRNGIKALHLVEAHYLALQCAAHNVTDPRASFHWADARTWTSPDLLDFVVMNPPFHAGRQGMPDLGVAFISAAASLLTRKGHLWMVANRHLPYEDSLAARFRHVEDLGGDRRYKLIRATGPQRRR